MGGGKRLISKQKGVRPIFARLFSPFFFGDLASRRNLFAALGIRFRLSHKLVVIMMMGRAHRRPARCTYLFPRPG